MRGRPSPTCARTPARRSFLRVGVLAIPCAGLPSRQAWGQGNAIRLVVPYPPGGPVDLLARIVAQGLGEESGQPVVVENKGGANGLIGVEAAARAQPDGRTLLMGSTSTHSINPLLYDRLPYDPVADFVPVMLLGTRPYALVVRPSIQATSVKELVALAKARPGALTYASGGGTGSGNHLAGELFKARTGTDLLHVPYKGGGPALNDVLGGQVDMFFAPIPTVLPHVEAGKLRALAVTGAKRSSVLPDVPTMAQAGVEGFEFSIWDGIYAPAGTPADTVAAINARLRQVMRSPEVARKFAALGADVAAGTPAEMAAYVRADAAKWAQILKNAGAVSR